MRAIWKGSITFGLVNVPVSLFPATRREELSFRLLRAHDLSPINYKRIAEVDGKEVPWEEIVKGYEYDKGKFVVLRDEDFKRVDIEATQTIDIVDFVKLEEINPMFFNKPYYLEPGKGAGRVYGLLREVLHRTGMTGVAKVVIKTRQHLAAIKANRELLLLEVMHFADELVEPKELSIPKAAKIAPRELAMAETLVGQMSEKWDPKRYTDEYRSALMHLIKERIKHGGRNLPATGGKERHSDKVIDLMSALQESLNRGQPSVRRKSAHSSAKRRPRKKAA